MLNLKNEVSLCDHYPEVGTSLVFAYEVKTYRPIGYPVDFYHLLRRWCASNCRQRFTHIYLESGPKFWFEDKRDAVHFKLVWS